MIEIQQSDEFKGWFAKLGDKIGKRAIASRIDRLRFGLLGDAEPVGDGLSELRIHVGPGYRVYIMQQGKTLIVVLAAGTKRGQQRDINAARKLAAEMKGME